LSEPRFPRLKTPIRYLLAGEHPQDGHFPDCTKGGVFT
jgi:hypothetical protein